MDIDDFFVCFKSIIVYHKPSSYKYCEKATELKARRPFRLASIRQIS